MKVLYINYIFQKGHINFDHIHIDALIRQATEVKLVLHKDIAMQLPYPPQQYALIIPSFFNYDSTKGFVNRFFYLITLMYIKIHLSFKRYDKVILSSLDEITLGMIPLCSGMNIICHDNGRNLGKGLKGFFLKNLSKRNSFLVFNEQMSKPFLHQGCRFHIVSHGCILPNIKKDYDHLPIDISSFKTIIYHPSNRPNKRFFEKLEEDKDFLSFLEENSILLILRSTTVKDNVTKNFVFINHYLNPSEYQSLFHHSDIILMAYPEDFSCRVSGVSFECVSNKKRALVKDNLSLRYCRDFFNYDPIFTDTQQLKERIKFLINHPEATCIATPENLYPDYQLVLTQ